MIPMAMARVEGSGARSVGRGARWAFGAMLLSSAPAWADSQYDVVPGDNIGAIVSKMQVPLDEVLRANPQVKDPNKIYPGMKLNIPASSPLAGGSGVPAEPAAALPDKAEPTRVRADVVRQGVPQGLLKLRGLTFRGVQGDWEVVIPDCGQDPCSATVTIENIGKVPVAGLQVNHSLWYDQETVVTDCGQPLEVGASCSVTVTHPAGLKMKSPGFIIVQASDAFIRPPDDETLWFWDTVFWICAAADDPRCVGKPAPPPEKQAPVAAAPAADVPAADAAPAADAPAPAGDAAPAADAPPPAGDAAPAPAGDAAPATDAPAPAAPPPAGAP